MIIFTKNIHTVSLLNTLNLCVSVFCTNTHFPAITPPDLVYLYPAIEKAQRKAVYLYRKNMPASTKHTFEAARLSYIPKHAPPFASIYPIPTKETSSKLKELLSHG